MGSVTTSATGSGGSAFASIRSNDLSLSAGSDTSRGVVVGKATGTSLAPNWDIDTDVVVIRTVGEAPARMWS
jgi:hypothetical protein